MSQASGNNTIRVSLELLICQTASMPAQIGERIIDALTATLTEGYGIMSFHVQATAPCIPDEDEASAQQPTRTRPGRGRGSDRGEGERA